MKRRIPKGQLYGQIIARKMATQKPMTKYAMLRKWPTLGSIYNIDQGIDWIEANTGTSDNPFLFVWDRGKAVWGFKTTFAEVALNLSFNLGYIRTRMATFERVLNHSISSPVVHMTPAEKRAAKSVSAQAGGVIAYIDSMIHALP